MQGYNILLNFLIKYLFIMNAASDGWRICYIGGNRFEFYNNIYYEANSAKSFVNKYMKYKYKYINQSF
jgi:hypothetical protein